MDDLLACSDLCAKVGFDRQAELFRSIADGRARVYVVVERGQEPEFGDMYYLNETGEPRAVFLDRGDAEREAALRNARKFREVNVLNYGWELDDLTDLPGPELDRRLGEILGRPCPLAEGAAGPNPDEPRPGVSFPADATDEQMLAIAALFKLEFFHVAEADLAG